MLCLAPGSACDVCLEGFGDALKAPCSIDCGHVFCVDCIDHITRPLCPLCRTPYDPRYVSKLHVDLDPTAPTPRDNAEEQEIRPWLERIAKFAKEGGDEQTLRTLIDECFAFLKDRPRTQPIKDLHVIIKLINYLCDTKSQLRQLKRSSTSMQEEVERSRQEVAGVHAEHNMLRGQNYSLEKKVQELEAARRAELDARMQIEVELRRQLSETQAGHIELLRKVSNDHDALKDELESLREQLRQVYAPIVASAKEKLDGFPVHSHGGEDDSSVNDDGFKLRGTSLVDEGAFFSPLPDIGLRDPEKFFGPEVSPSAPPSQPVEISVTPADDMPSGATTPSAVKTPSMLSMTAPGSQYQGLPHRPSSPSSSQTTEEHNAYHVPFPVQYGPHLPSDCQVYRPAGADHLRNRFLEIMRDESPIMSSSMPNLTGDHFPINMARKEKPVPQPPSTSTTASRPVQPSGQSSSTQQPIPLPPVKATAAVTPSSSYSQASLVAAALEDKKRQQRKAQEQAQEDERKRKDSEKIKDYKNGPQTPAGSPPPHRFKGLDLKGVDGARDYSERPEIMITRSSSTRKHSSTSSANTPQASRTSSSTSHPYQEGDSKKSIEGRSNGVRPSLNPSSSSSQPLKAAPTVASSTPRDPPSYRSAYSSSMGPSKGKMAASMLSNQASVSVA
ncbi:hypothetical protein WG66_000191 [Moniliophthora roreri]|nr:hypothetical protein WG66_000191 [Moniliophthora roreri]